MTTQNGPHPRCASKSPFLHHCSLPGLVQQGAGVRREDGLTRTADSLRHRGVWIADVEGAISLLKRRSNRGKKAVGVHSCAHDCVHLCTNSWAGGGIRCKPYLLTLLPYQTAGRSTFSDLHYSRDEPRPQAGERKSLKNICVLSVRFGHFSFSHHRVVSD